ncbi:MAG: transposase family protein [Bacteroidales bacterium]|nr:transposase family protein [Bacteroidales bacterium]
MEQQVIALRKAHPKLGKRSIANELTKRNNWTPLVSPNTVQRILKDTGLWPQEQKKFPSKGPSGKARTAEKPGQSINVDLAFVPASHETVKKLPAVSGSSGRLVVEQMAEETDAVPQWPGCVFEDNSLSYEEAMKAFMAASEAKSKTFESASSDSSTDVTIKAQKRAISHEEEALRAQRRQVRQQRKKEEAEWAALQVQHRVQQAAVQGQKQKALPIHPAPGFSQEAANSEPSISANPSDATLPLFAQGASGVYLNPAYDTKSACSEATGSTEPDASTNAPPAEKKLTLLTKTPCIIDEKWGQHREERRAQLAQRREEDEQWRSQRESIRERLAKLPVITSWFCILVIIDNCTRICYGLPLFVAGQRVTAEEIVNALQTLLPPELMFLISDRGIHFRAKVFKALAKNKEFLHVFTARHRPQSNGIAERFVRTFKEWLADKSWTSEQELLALLDEFQAIYNDRPHQGIPMRGLSPNEYARRVVKNTAQCS